ncbi:regulator of (H+)-ATPase in vacuolar membrane [Xylographa trunciseda]|nr:regulator of (H+)-ATPase in vacuolar membrane [Xylographa trunciseda]
MRAVLPGKPQATLQAVCTTQWNGKRLVVYISGNALVILGGPHQLLQTIYHDDTQILGAVAIDKETGKIATCSPGSIHIYRPYGHNEDVLKWSLQYSFPVTGKALDSYTLSWGALEELLVGSTTLSLYKTNEQEVLIWRRELSSPATSALFSPDSGLIASNARYDRLVKLWRRLSYGSDDVRFDFSYLSHPATVTGVHWRASEPREQGADILYTICADNKVRVWASTDPHASQVLQLWAELDVQASIQPRNLDSQPSLRPRYVFFIDSHDFVALTKAGLQAATIAERGKHALEHLSEIAERKPEICVVLDNHGHMSAWGFENVGSRAREPKSVFNIAHVENFNLLLPQSISRSGGCVRLLGFCIGDLSTKYAVLAHHFDGRIVWLEGSIDDFFDPSPRRARLQVKSLWTGHEGSVKKMVRTASGQALISRTNDNEGIIWKQRHGNDGTVLSRASFLDSPEHIHRTWLFVDGKFTANLHHHSVSLWDTRNYEAKQIARCEFQLQGRPLCLLELPCLDEKLGTKFLATISSHMEGIVWKLTLPQGIEQEETRSHERSTISQHCSFNLGTATNVVFVIPVDPAGSTSITAGILDTFSQDIALSYTESGVLYTWAAKVEMEKGTVDWLMTAQVDTGISRPFLTSGSSTRKIALVNSARNGLTIWDSRSGQMEFSKEYSPQEMIQDLDWTSTPDLQSILAIGFPHRVIVLAQIRYDYLDKGPAWASIREINIRESTPHPIGDSTWLGSGNLVIGAGTQLFVYDKLITTSDEMITDLSLPTHGHASVDIFDVVALLNGPLPVYHPQFLAQCILAGKMSQVSKIIISLNTALKFFDGDHLDSLLSLSAEDFFMNQQDLLLASTRKEKHSDYAEFSDDEESDSITEGLLATLNENLTKVPMPYLSSQEQMHLADIIECVAMAEKHRRSMDENAMRYIVFVRQHLIRTAQGRKKHVGITWREIAWAFHSGSQDILVDLVSRQFNGRVLWEHARASGMFMWMSDIDALRAQFETVARNEYTKTDEKNPIDCSLYYMALKKKAVLLGLWRMAAWNREQSSTQKFLANNFQEHRWKTAALKNAYALLGKRRFEYAAAFFLLAGNLRDAVNICAQQMRDIQLAITIARVYEGDHGPVLHDLLKDRVLPMAAFEGNRWLAMWAFWMLGRRDMAVRSLITPVYTLLPTPEAPSQEARSYLTTDPALVVLYKQLRDKSLQTLKGASQILPRTEWEFVIQTARLYDRMGCDLLALDLVRNWEFLAQPKDTLQPLNQIPDPRKMLRRRSSLVVDDLPSPKFPAEQRMGNAKGLPTQTAWKEPDANSLLDSFGF